MQQLGFVKIFSEYWFVIVFSFCDLSLVMTDHIIPEIFHYKQE